MAKSKVFDATDVSEYFTRKMPSMTGTTIPTSARGGSLFDFFLSSRSRAGCFPERGKSLKRCSWISLVGSVIASSGTKWVGREKAGLETLTQKAERLERVVDKDKIRVINYTSAIPVSAGSRPKRAKNTFQTIGEDLAVVKWRAADPA